MSLAASRLGVGRTLARTHSLESLRSRVPNGEATEYLLATRRDGGGHVAADGPPAGGGVGRGVGHLVPIPGAAQ